MIETVTVIRITYKLLETILIFYSRAGILNYNKSYRLFDYRYY